MGEDADVAVVEERYAVIEPRNPIEWLNFAILVAVFIIAILVVALSRPYIFGRVVPTVLGEDQPTAPLVEDVDQVIKEEPEEGATGGLEEPEAAGEEAAPASEATPAAEEFPTSVPTVTHVVQRGETLYAIARQYGTTVDVIVQANNIANPNRVNVGTSLLIPQP